MKKENKDKLFYVGLAMVVIGMVVPGLWPWQLPCCFIGGWIMGSSI